MNNLKQGVCDIVYYKNNIEMLDTKVKVLIDETSKVQRQLNNNREIDIGIDVKQWIQEADEFLQKADSMTSCKKRLCGPCWDPSSFRETNEMLRDISKMLEDREGLDLSSYCKNLQSRENMIQGILEALADVHINIIGIHGMIGVGKTILVEELAKRSKTNQLFDAIVIVHLSPSSDIKHIQAQIGDVVGVPLPEADDEETRALFLYKAFEEKAIEGRLENTVESSPHGKILLILDGMQHAIDLVKLGILYEQQEKASCKVVLTSRNPDLSETMGVDKEFLVKCLNLDEAKILFQKRHGNKITSVENTHERCQYVENGLLMKCRGLPLLISSLACVLRSTSHDWEIIADEMERRTWVEVDQVKQVPHEIFNLCSNFMMNGKRQKLFLLCCLIHQGMDTTVDRLKRYGIGFGLFEDPSLAYATQQVNLWVDELKSLSILLESKDSQNIKMNEIIQDVVLSALFQGDDILHVILDAGNCWYTRESYENCIAISMMPDGNEKCLNGLELHKLQALLLKDRSSLSLPDNYFQGMQNLRILDIYRTTFVELPSSIGNLKNLVTLHLECCGIKCISSISKLVKLEVLSLRRSSVENSLVEIGNLTNLRVLDLTRCNSLFRLGVDVLVGLNQLRELYVRGSSRSWIEFTKLNSSLNLQVLEIDISPDQLSPGTLSYSWLRRFIICIEGNLSREEFNSFSHVLVFNGEGRFQLEESGLIDLLPWTEMLQIKDARGLCSGISNLSTHGFLHLKKMDIESCSGIECIVDAEKSPMSQRKMFPELQILTLKDLPKFERICCWSQSYSSFPNLRELTLQDLRRLHPHGIPIQLAKKLRHLKVIDCTGLHFIFRASTKRILKLPCLVKLELKGLMNLQSIQDPSNHSITVDELQRPYHVLFNDKIEFPSLKDMCLVTLSQIKKLWDEEHYGRDPWIRSLKSMKIIGCGNLEYLFSTNIIDSLLQLEEVEVRSCGRLKEVITSHANDGASPSKMKIFPKLQTLILEHLMSLQCFYRGSFLLKFPALRVLKLRSLEDMMTFIDPVNANAQSLHPEPPLFIEEVSFPSLEHLEVSGMEVEFIQGQEDITIFPSLSSLTLESLPHLKSTPDIESKNVRVLCLADVDCIKVPSSMWPVNMPPILAHSLEELTLSGFYCEEELIDKFNLIESELLSSLMNLKLRNIQWTEPRTWNVQWNVLRNLRLLSIQNVDIMTSLISTSLLVGGSVLHHLEYMYVESCRSMQVIISEELAVDEDFVKYGVTLFPSLKKISLFWLPKLEFFSRGSYEALFPSLEEVRIYSCKCFQSFSLGTVRAPRLNSLKLGGKWLQPNTFGDLNVILKEWMAEEHSRREQDREASDEEEEVSFDIMVPSSSQIFPPEEEAEHQKLKQTEFAVTPKQARRKGKGKIGNRLESFMSSSHFM